MKRLALTLLFAAALPLSAGATLFERYEAVRQGLLTGSLADVQKNADVLAKEAAKGRLTVLAGHAAAVAKSDALPAARSAFGPLSDEMIRLRNEADGNRPAVYYCSMVKKSWLQARGKVGNPYDPSMQMCGELKAE